MNEARADIAEIRIKCAELQKINSTKPVLLSFNELKDQINTSLIRIVRGLFDESARMLKEIDGMESACRGGIWETLSSNLNAYSSLLDDECAADGYNVNITKCEKAMAAVTRLKDAASGGGVLTCIDNLDVKFFPTTEISLGRIEESMGWRLVKKIDLPVDKAGKMNAFITLSDRRVAVGYSNIGVDIIGIDDEQRVRILDDTKIYGLTEIGNDALAVCNTSAKLSIYNVSSASDETSSFMTKQSSKCTCLSTDARYNIYLGYSEFKTIEVFKQSGGSPIRIIKTELEPWFISVMKTGHIAVTQCTRGIKDAVHVIKQDGTVVCRIPGRDNYAPYSTCDQLGNIYVAMRHKSGKTNIKKYSSHGDVLETIKDGLQTPQPKEKEWLQVSCVSPTELVVCDAASIYVFQRRPSLTELMGLM